MRRSTRSWRSSTCSTAASVAIRLTLRSDHGAWRWEYAREFADLIADATQQWRWVPRFEHLLIDQTELGAAPVAARLLQMAMMAALREEPGELLEWVTRLIGDLYRDTGFEEMAKHAEYVLAQRRLSAAG